MNPPNHPLHSKPSAGGPVSSCSRRILASIALAVTFLLIALFACLFLTMDPSAAPKVSYYVDKDGEMIADIRWKSRYLKVPFFRLKASNISGTVLVWREGGWEADQSFLKSLRWSHDQGYRFVARVPDAKWKASFSWAMEHDVGTRSAFINWRAETNTIYSPELLSLAEANDTLNP